METFDLRDTIIPFSLLQISNFFKQMKPGESIEIIGPDESIAQDLKRILNEPAYEAILTENRTISGTELRIRLMKQSKEKKNANTHHKEEHHVRSRT